MTLREPLGIALSIGAAVLASAFLFVGDASLVAYLLTVFAIGFFVLRTTRSRHGPVRRDSSQAPG